MAGPYTAPRRVPVLAAAAVAACAALTSCGDGSATTAGPPSSAASTSTTPARAPAKDSPSGEKLVLRWRMTGGIAGVGGPGSVPEFSLYSTGRAIVSSGEPQGELTEHHLTPEALQRLLKEARAAGLGRSHTVGSEQIMDAFVLVFTMDGATTRVIQPESQNGPEGKVIKRLDPEAWPASDRAAAPRPYTPEKTAVLAGETTGGGEAKTWPLAPLGGGEQAAGAICTLAPSAKVPSTAGAPGTTWRSGGKTYTVRLRPLLPAESTCEDIT